MTFNAAIEFGGIDLNCGADFSLRMRHILGSRRLRNYLETRYDNYPLRLRKVMV